MGLFELFRKKTGPGPVTDEKKLKEVARYQAGDHQLIKDLQVRPLGKTDTYIEGRVFNTLWNREIDVDIYGNASIEYAHRCAEAMNAMPDGLVDAICYAAKRYCLDFLDAVGGAEENGIFAERKLRLGRRARHRDRRSGRKACLSGRIQRRVALDRSYERELERGSAH